MGVIIIIAVFWLFGLLTAWSMCVSRHEPTDVWKRTATPVNGFKRAGWNTKSLTGSGADYKKQIHMISLRFK